MSKLYAPLGYVIDNEDGYYDANNRDQLLEGALNLGEWPDDLRTDIKTRTREQLIELFLDNGFELVEQE